MEGGKVVYEGGDLLQAALREVAGQEDPRLLLLPRWTNNSPCSTNTEAS